MKIINLLLVLLAVSFLSCTDTPACTESENTAVTPQEVTSGLPTKTATVRVKRQGSYSFYDMTTSMFLAEFIKPDGIMWVNIEVDFTDNVYCVYEDYILEKWEQSEISPVLFDAVNLYNSNGKWGSWSE